MEQVAISEHNPWAARWPNWFRLLFISFLTLYFELLVIRWLPTEIRILAYFSNMTLVSCILGMGLGALIAHDVPYRPSRFLGLLACLITVTYLYHGIDLQLPIVSESHFIWNGLSRRATGTFVQYVALFAFLAINTATFVPLGQALGLEFDRLPPLSAYSINVLGAILGIGAFALFSLFQLPPVVWFGVGIVLFFLLVPWTGEIQLAAVLCLVLATVVSWEAGSYWSPYYKVSVEARRLGDEWVGFRVSVNEDGHQEALDLSGSYDRDPSMASRRRTYDVPYRYGTNDTVLIMGAGTGNDVAAALRAGASLVEAVEIDPVILSLGMDHPERPYQDPRVQLVNQDARGYLRTTTQKYDKIVLGYLDSHALFSAMSSVRLDNFIYTREFFREMKTHLKPKGLLVVTFTVHEEWIANRLFTLFQETFGKPPLVYQGDRHSNGVVFLGGKPLEEIKTAYLAFNPTTSNAGHTWSLPEHAGGYISPETFTGGVAVPTDDWPYLYLRKPSIPLNYLIPLLFLLALGLLYVRSSASGFKRVNLHFFFLGSGFLLVETKAMTELAIFLGSTWVVNAFVISTILVLILLANWIASSRWCPSVGAAYGALGVTLMTTYFAPLHVLLGWESPLRNWVAVTVLCLPLFFAGLIFAQNIKKERQASAALGANLMGAIAGGALEYVSMTAGLKVLYLLGLGLYILSLVFYRRDPRLRAA